MMWMLLAQMRATPMPARPPRTPQADTRPAGSPAPTTPTSTTGGPTPASGPTAPSAASDPARRAREAEDRYLAEQRTRQDREALEARERDRMELELRSRALRIERERQSLARPGIGGSLAGFGLPLRGAENPDGSAVRYGGFEYALIATALVGYNDNVVQTLEDPVDRLVRRRGSPFIGVDVMGIVQHLGKRTDHDFRLQLRGQHYVPISKGYNFTDDGTINAGWSMRHEAAKQTTLGVFLVSTLSTLNSSRQSDGAVFRIDPYSAQRTFTLTTGRIAIEQELGERWRYIHGVNLAVSTVLDDAPILLQSGARIAPRGIDFVQPSTDATLFHDLSYEDILFATLRYEYLYSRIAYDLSSNPPRNAGPITTHLSEARVGWTHLFSPSFSATSTVGTQLATPFSADPDQRVILSPIVQETLAYVKPAFYAGVQASYSYGSVNPRIGFGTTLDASATAVWTPFERVRVLRDFSLLANALLSRAALRATAAESQTLNVYAGSFEARWAVSHNVALMGGANYRYAGIAGSDTIPPLWRTMVFVGLTYFWNTQRVMPPLTNFAPPLQGG